MEAGLGKEVSVGKVVSGAGDVGVIGVPAQLATIDTANRRLSTRSGILESLSMKHLPSRTRRVLLCPDCSAYPASCQAAAAVPPMANWNWPDIHELKAMSHSLLCQKREQR